MHLCTRRRISQSPWVPMWRYPMRLAVSPQSAAPAPFCMRQHARTLQVWFTAALPAFSAEFLLPHFTASYLSERQTHLPRLSQRSCMHCEARRVVQAREVHSLEARPGPSCPSATSTNSRTGPPSQVHTPAQVLASVLNSWPGTRTTVHLLNMRPFLAAPGLRPGPQSCLLIV